jgi:hypothetical protein
MTWLGAVLDVEACECGGACAECGGDAVGLGGLGDVINIEGDCKQGEANVAEMESMFATMQQMHPELAPQYQAPHDAIKAAYDAAEASAGRQVPYSPVCGQIREYGDQAAAMTQQMAAAMGVKAPPKIDPPTLGGTIAKWIIGGVVVILVAGGGIYVLDSVVKRQMRKRFPL